jgi:dihydroorotate dehydrogenase electron transfer subunit
MSKIQDEFKIVNKLQPTETCFDYSIYCPELAEITQAGQFVHIYCGEKTLRRPISVCQTNKQKGIIRIVFEIRGEGTLWLSKRKKGEFLNILGPLGNGFPTDKNKKALLIGGGIGVPPLLECSKCYSSESSSILGFRSQENAILIEDFIKNCAEVYIATEDGTLGTKGFVTDVLNDLLAHETFDVICACGPTPMLKAVSHAALCNSIECFVSMEERMACGIGACLVCACKTKKDGKEGYSHVCKNGPVFNAQEVVW